MQFVVCQENKFQNANLSLAYHVIPELLLLAILEAYLSPKP